MSNNNNTVKVAVTGANGRMGQELLQECISNNGIELTEALVRSANKLLGKDVSTILGKQAQPVIRLNYTSQSEVLKKETELLIDFTLPENTLSNIQACIKSNKSIVIGTTGFSPEQQQVITDASSHIAILQASNMSIGVNLTLALLKQASSILGADVKVEIIETHHIHKKDSPSGTAITMGEVIANSNNKILEDCMVIDDTEKLSTKTGSIKFTSIREGEVIGDHRVSFIMDDEVIEVSHRAINRNIFAKGAARAAIWLSDKEPGLYSMNDVLGLTNNHYVSSKNLLTPSNQLDA